MSEAGSASPQHTASKDTAILSWFAYLVLSLAWLLIAVHSPLRGWDFPQFYIAAHLPLRHLYDREEIVRFGEQHVPIMRGGRKYIPPYVRPPVFALPLRTLQLFRYWEAFWIWAGVAWIAYTAAAYLLIQGFGLPHGFAPAFAMFFPAQFGILTGQDITAVLLLFVAVLVSVRSGRGRAAGALLALCLYKFNLAGLCGLALARNRRAFGVFAAIAAVLAGASIAIAPMGEYLAMLGKIPEYSRELEYWGLRGTIAALGWPSWCYYAAAAATAALGFYAALGGDLAHSLVAAMLVALLCSPHAMWYDMAILAIPVAYLWPRGGLAMRCLMLLVLVAPPVRPFWTAAFHSAAAFALLVALGRGRRSKPNPV